MRAVSRSLGRVESVATVQGFQGGNTGGHRSFRKSLLREQVRAVQSGQVGASAAGKQGERELETEAAKKEEKAEGWEHRGSRSAKGSDAAE